MDNFDYKKYLSEGKLLKEEVTENRFLSEDFPGKGEIVKAEDLNYDMLDYFDRMNVKLLINTKSKKNIKGSVGTMFNDLVFNGGDIDKKDIVSVKIYEVEVKETKNTSTIYEKEVNGRYGLKYSGKITKGTDADFPYQISVSGGNAEGDNGSFSGFEATEEGAKNRAETKLKELAKYGTFSKEDKMRIKAGLKK